MKRAAILGSGKVGFDLLIKLLQSRSLVPGPFLGRNPKSLGLAMARDLDLDVSAQGVEYLVGNPHLFDMVFDASSRDAHAKHGGILTRFGKPVINLTPVYGGLRCIPVLNLEACLDLAVVHMGTSAAQAAAPVAFALRQVHGRVEHIEATATLGAMAAGPATLREVRAHARDAERALSIFSGCASARAALDVDSLDASGHMRLHVVARVPRAQADPLREALQPLVRDIGRYAPRYRVSVSPSIGPHWLEISVQSLGGSGFPPGEAGNLDLVNGAALALAEAKAERMESLQTERSFPGAA